MRVLRPDPGKHGRKTDGGFHGFPRRADNLRPRSSQGLGRESEYELPPCLNRQSSQRPLFLDSHPGHPRMLDANAAGSIPRSIMGSSIGDRGGAGLACRNVNGEPGSPPHPFRSAQSFQGSRHDCGCCHQPRPWARANGGPICPLPWRICGIWAQTRKS
jgi:hypothetical protein